MKNRLAGLILLCLSCVLLAAAPVEKKIGRAPDFNLRDLDGVRVSSSDFRDKKPVVLFFWTTWCPYCQRALKNLNQILPELEKDGITVLAINSGESPAKVARFAKSGGLNFRIFLDPDSEVSDAYHVYGVPDYFIVDKKGFIRSTSNTFPLEEAKQTAREK